MALAPVTKDGKRLRRRYGKVRSHLFTFLDHPDACVPSDSTSYSARVCGIDCANGAPCPGGQRCADPGNGFKTCTSSPTPGSPPGLSATCKQSPAATSWDVAADFAGDANPCAPWTYGYTRGLGTAPLTVYSSTRTPNPVFWTDPSNDTSSTPSAGQNASASTLFGIAPGQFSLHGGPNGEYSVARWTAPRAGTFAVRVQFFSGDVADTDGAVLRGSNVLFQHDTDPQPTYTSTLSMAVGETLDVAVGKIGRFESGSTPVTFTVEQQ